MTARHPSRALLRTLAILLALATAGLPAGAQLGGVGPFDGDPATTERIEAGDPVTAAIAVSQQRFDTAPHAVLATVDSFADSLAGAALTDDGPLLLTASARLTPATAAELDRVLGDGATVYVLGGEDAIGPAVADELTAAGYAVARLAGETRVETALAVADEVRRRHPGDTVLLARSDGPADNPTSAWADSMTGGSLAAARGLPILVTPTDALHPAVATWLAADAPVSTVLLGGDAALSDAVEDAAPNPRRLAGPERTATAAAIAEDALWRGPGDAPDARRFVILDAGRPDGWAYGLSAAGIAADTGAPPLAVVGTVSAATRRVVSTCGDPAVDLLLVGDESVIDTEVEAQLTTFDGTACADAFAALDPFESCPATLDFFRAEALERVTAYGLDGHYHGGVDPVPPPVGPDRPGEEEPVDGGAPPAPPPAPSAPDEDAGGDDGGVGGGEDTPTSGTNTQEVGVDEPDRVKATAQAAYVVAGQGVQVVDVSGDAPVHVMTLDVPEAAYGHELLLDTSVEGGEVLVVLSSGDGFAYPAEPAPAEDVAFAPGGYYPEPTTILTRYDVSDPTAPVRLDAVELDGAYRSARMVGGVVRLVASANPTGLDFTVPTDSSDEAHQTSLAHNRQVIEESAITDWLPSVRGPEGESLAVPCEAVFAPPGFSGISTALVTAFDISESLTPTSAAAVLAQAETLYASTERLVLTSSRWGAWNPEAPTQQVTTEVHSFDISDLSATRYVASGQVDGWVLNQFSISERDGYYRIATTTQPPFDDPAGATDNGITVLTEGGSELFEVGRVFGLGAGEQIFAVRYLGPDLAAVVTFRQVDPLYLVDLSNPAAPRVTGELKIPGVSRYLHPIGEDHLLGVGQDGTDDGRLTGVQVSLFDISDLANPVRVDEIGYGQGSSPVEHDHKAFLFWSPLGRAFVPTELYERGEFPTQVIDVDATAGTLSQVGTIGAPPEVYAAADRTLVVGDTVYAISYAGISAHDLTTLAQEGYAAFPGTEEPCCAPGGPDQPVEGSEPVDDGGE
ncbi:beta-propeller domain-containing protein [Euzebya sp.]|uniref:beta-propeller domain-containing protein n=1 Tax=Euzebya sp. TaxID=1971409 RepID=UPI003519A059